MGFNHNLIKILSFIPHLEVRISKSDIAIKIYNDVIRNPPRLMSPALLILGNRFTSQLLSFQEFHSQRYTGFLSDHR